MGNLKIVVGSWKAYNECNERALGSHWLDLTEFNSVEEITEELLKEGFTKEELEETFIQDIDFDMGDMDCDCMTYERLYNLLEEGDILNDGWKQDLMEKFIEAINFDEFEERVEEKGADWTDDIYFYEGQTMEDIAREYVESCINLDDLPMHLGEYIDFEQMGRDIYYEGCYHRLRDGILEVRD